MNTNEIKEEIKKTRKQLEELEAKLEAKLEASKKWEPTRHPYKVELPDFDMNHRIFTAESIILAKHIQVIAKNLLTLQSLANELNNGWIYDPYNPHQPANSKFEVVYTTEKDRWVVISSVPYYYRNVPYFKSKEIAQQACDILNSQRDLVEI